LIVLQYGVTVSTVGCGCWGKVLKTGRGLCVQRVRLGDVFVLRGSVQK